MPVVIHMDFDQYSLVGKSLLATLIITAEFIYHILLPGKQACVCTGVVMPRSGYSLITATNLHNWKFVKMLYTGLQTKIPHRENYIYPWKYFSCCVDLIIFVLVQIRTITLSDIVRFSGCIFLHIYLFLLL